MRRRCLKRRWRWPATGWWSSVRARRRALRGRSRVMRWTGNPVGMTFIRRKRSSPETASPPSRASPLPQDPAVYTDLSSPQTLWERACPRWRQIQTTTNLSGRLRPISPHKQPHHFPHMALGRIPGQRLATAIQQAKIPRTLEQAEKVLSRVARFVDAQRATLIDPCSATAPSHAACAAARPRRKSARASGPGCPGSSSAGAGSPIRRC